MLQVSGSVHVLSATVQVRRGVWSHYDLVGFFVLFGGDLVSFDCSSK
jgi:hypothetical protein